MTQVQAGACLFHQGAQADALYILAQGDVRMERSAFKKGFPAAYRGQGELLGEAGLGGERKHTETARTTRPCTVVRISLQLFDDRIASDGGLALGSLELLHQRRIELEQRVESLLYRGVEARLAEFLLESSRRWGSPSERGRLIEAPLTHLEIAQAIGSTRETVTLTLGHRRRAGALDVDGRLLIVRDTEDLEARVAGRKRLDAGRRRRSKVAAG